MKKALSLVMVFLVAVAFSATGYSADKYVSGNIGISWLNDYQAYESNDWAPGREEVGMDFDSGITLTGAFGCDYGDYRVEAELGYQSGDLNNGYQIIRYAARGDNGIGESEDTFDLDGDISVLSLMGNGYYDIDLGGVELFLTAGAGVAQVDFDDVTEVDEGEASENNWNVSEVTLAYQIGAGLALPVADNVMLEARYRYFATTDFVISDDLSERNNESPGYDREWKGNLESHSALLGLRVTL